MTPVFKSTFSIGKSILKLEEIIASCKQHDINPLVLVEDSMTGFVKSHTVCKDDGGCKLLNKIYSFSQMVGDGKVDCEYLNSVWSETSLGLVIPFYDSFIHNNQLYLKNCIPDFKNILPTFLLERNNLPFDHLLAEKVIKFAASTTRPVERVKTILYNKKADVEALQTYKILCNRNFGRAATLSSPNLNHFGSNEFCLESYLQYA